MICFRKMFIGGLSANSTVATMKEYFGRYGEIEDCVIMVDRDLKPWGFGFVTFRSLEAIKRVCGYA